MTTFRTELDWYIRHQDELVAKYDGKFIMVQGEELIGVYESMKDSWDAADGLGLDGKVFCHEVGHGKGNYTGQMPFIRRLPKQ